MASKIITESEMIGRRNGRLVCLREVARRGKKRYFLFQCDCGKTKEIMLYSFAIGRVKSCGCISIENLKAAVAKQTQHMGFPAEFKTWSTMIDRCERPTHQNYASYGGRGITVCQRWKDSFESFLKDMGQKPTPKHSIDRIDNNKGYSPENCRWATQREQNRNRRNNHVVTHEGKTMVLSDWADARGWNRNVLYFRLKNGWSVADALTKPVRTKAPNHSAARRPS
jgi:hypothetical protein